MSNNKDLLLIVDDNPQNIQFLGGLLSENCYDLGVAQNGIETLAFVKDKTPDLILLDIIDA
jgi:CheY-like chemotaxis protein